MHTIPQYRVYRAREATPILTTNDRHEAYALANFEAQLSTALIVVEVTQ